MTIIRIHAPKKSANKLSDSEKARCQALIAELVCISLDCMDLFAEKFDKADILELIQCLQKAYEMIELMEQFDDSNH